jgi:hypothetical protein
MINDRLGELLYKAGWNQGILLPALPYSVIYKVDEPLSKIAKSANKHRGVAGGSQKGALLATGLPSGKIGVAFGIPRQEDHLVIASQDCDIVRNVNEEPNIVAMRAFVTENERILRYANGNSSRYFLLDQNRGLVAESTLMALIEKPVFLDLKPELGAFDVATKLRFARWVAHRFDRFPFPDNVVGAVIKPLLENFSQMQRDNDVDLDALDTVREIRLAQIAGNPPFDVRILFIIPESGLPDGGLALARLVNRIREWFNPLAARLTAWDARHIYEITVGDYLDTQQIYLDHYTYQGQTIQGLLPPPGI